MLGHMKYAIKHIFAIYVILNSVFFSPSGIVQMQKESFIPKFGKYLIVVSIHVTCNQIINTSV